MSGVGGVLASGDIADSGGIKSCSVPEDEAMSMGGGQPATVVVLGVLLPDMTEAEDEDAEGLPVIVKELPL